MKKLPPSVHLTPDQLVHRWTQWLQQTEKEARHLYRSRYTFENVRVMFVANGTLQKDGGHILEWMHHNFYTHHLIAIRREMDTSSGFLTLVNFLRELELHCDEVLTRKRFRALWKNPTLVEYGIPDDTFDGLTGATCKLPRDSDEDYVSADSVLRTRKRLVRDTQRVVDFANWFVAHRTNHDGVKLTLADCYKAVNRIYDVFALYRLIITGTTFTSRYATAMFDWHAPFAYPWITEGFEAWEPPPEP